MSMSDALNMPVSFESDYYQSEAWNQRKKAIEYSDTLQLAIVNRLNVLIEIGAKR